MEHQENQTPSSPRPGVALLPPEVARRIAAGEVIEKPASVVRELLDNALDAGSSSIDISWENGGSDLIRVRDDGAGMSREDLLLCWQTHATSKIRSMEDLERATSLGFRGEALASIAAVSDLTIESTPGNHPSGHRVEVRDAELQRIQAAPPRPGTAITVARLFANMPARKRFLSRPQNEAQAIRETILEKAFPFPGVRFSFPAAGGRQEVLPEQTLLERAGHIFSRVCPPQSLTQLQGSGEGFSCTVIAAHPEVIRRNRKAIHIYINNRRVTEFKFVQAVEYAYQDVQHGGVFPVAAVFLTVDPELTDFNIHPAKREVRLRRAAEIHHRLVELLRSHLHAFALRAARWEEAAEAPPSLFPRENPSPRPPRPHLPPRGGKSSPGALPSRGGHGPKEPFGHTLRAVPSPTDAVWPAPPPSPAPSREEIPLQDHTSSRREPPPRGHADPREPSAASPTGALRFHGTVFGTFNLVERGDDLYMIDQHAAHERLLYDRLGADRIPQKLLIPEEFEVTADQDTLLERHQEEYRKLGIILERTEGLRWSITALPGEYRLCRETLVETVLELGGLQDQFDREFLARIACKAAIKAGDYLDSITGEELARRVLELDEPRCPHGRPLWITLNRAHLEELIGRRQAPLSGGVSGP
ncbi:hypothetical protein AU468_00610 [Alkalispirochaeta sphaeroplastigenens]|uniref:DNA mismatch repair protein MutL n=1 Tax=Alkalispirochaeta sphaeroplastigenens TaxID=1187066 RepID=A0A2S4K0W4_9SPIO|nr:DNA mismatch repair endonuclease MutL [Alkalispirochaeta sphaeroplastigenens]POR05410.1 hypothetical protein AU468_00610 [Alkalispirochaeta sphaeroplastigenens]